jgi:hypothetical protein
MLYLAWVKGQQEKKTIVSPGVVVHAYNLTYFRGRDRRITA